jgi:hypothetical protein
MTPKEKSRELVDKYCFAIKTDVTDSGYFTNIIYAKECAIIAVNEIIDVCPYTSKYNCDTVEQLRANDIQFVSYWTKVKQEINKL